MQVEMLMLTLLIFPCSNHASSPNLSPESLETEIEECIDDRGSRANCHMFGSPTMGVSIETALTAVCISDH